jgi:integrase
MKLTKTAIAKLLRDGGAGIHWDDDLGGFGLRIYPSGAASFVADYRLRGSRRKRRIVLGTVALLSPDQARERARRVLTAARDGIDLDREQHAKAARQEAEKQRRANRISVQKAAAAYLAAFEATPSKASGRRPVRPTARQEGVWLHRVKALGEIALEDLSAEQVRDILGATPPASRRGVFGALKRLFAWARRQGLMNASPLDEIDPPARPPGRDRTPSPSEVRTILKAADELIGHGRWHEVQRDGVWLLALTAQRRAEVAGMAWEDVDLKAAEWRQPGTKNKTGKSHVVPLGAIALDIVKRRWEGAGRPSEGLVLRGVRGGGRMDANLSDLQQVLRKETGIAFRLHDFRRAAVSAMAELGVDFAVADAILNHAASQSRGGMLGVYQHAELKPAKRRAMEVWESALFPVGDNVVALRA